MADNVGEQKPLLSGAKSPARSKPRESDDHILLEEEQDNLDMSKGHGDKKQPSAMFGVRLFNYRLSRRPNPPVRDEPAGGTPFLRQLPLTEDSYLAEYLFHAQSNGCECSAQCSIVIVGNCRSASPNFCCYL